MYPRAAGGGQEENGEAGRVGFRIRRSPKLPAHCRIPHAATRSHAANSIHQGLPSSPPPSRARGQAREAGRRSSMSARPGFLEVREGVVPVALARKALSPLDAEAASAVGEGGR
nr:unnamed protein product [Digitaria exilis]